jgi:hypothetical protein
MTAHKVLHECAGLLAAALISSPSLAAAGTTGSPGPNQLYGHITSNRTLTAASPGPNYQVIGDLTIDPGVTLTIESNVNIVVVAHSDFLATGNDPTRVELVVQGSLIALGSSGPVQIGSTVQDGWVGIDVAGTGHVELTNAQVGQCHDGVDVESGGLASLTNTQIGVSTYGVPVQSAGTASLTNCALTFGLVGIRVKAGGTATVSGGSVTSCSTDGILVEAGGTATVSGGSVTSCANGAEVFDGASLSIAHCTLSQVVNGLFFYPNSSGDIHACSISGQGGGRGIQLPFSIGTQDSLSPEPIHINGFAFGIEVVRPNLNIDHVIVSHCGSGIRCEFTGVTVSYCTLVGNSTGVYGSASVAVYNSILVGPGVGSGFYWAASRANYDDAWGYLGGEWGNAVMGSSNATYDPFFASGDPEYHLNPASFFTNFSVSGGQIGAYGPGVALTAAVAAASVLDAGGSNGVAHIRWFAESSGGSRARILRRTEQSEWQPLTVLYADGQGYISLDDRDVTPGERYGYGVGVQRGSTMGIEGEVWVTVVAPISGLAIQNVAPNPARTAWSVGFVSPATSEATLEAIDLGGRVVRTIQLGTLTPGARTVSLPAKGLPPGAYWIRVRESGSSSIVRAVKTN